MAQITGQVRSFVFYKNSPFFRLKLKEVFKLSKNLFLNLVFAIFRAEVRIIDTARRDALRRLLLESVKATGPGEKLDEKLASMALTDSTEDCKTFHQYLIMTFKLTICIFSTSS